MFSRGQRNGILLLLIIIICLQVLIFKFDTVVSFFEKPDQNENEQLQLLVYQIQIDSLKEQTQNKKFEIKPFNPNFISDYKGYVLGMSVDELDKLFAFRKEGKFVNSAKEFQQVTQVSDSLLEKISPYFKFPDWVTNKKTPKNSYVKTFEENKAVSKEIIKTNINTATKEELMKVYGIGDKISDVILNDRNKFGAFVDIDQLQYVWGVDFNSQTFENIKKYFFVDFNTSQLKKLNINVASINELKQFPYFNYKIAKEIVTYRSMNGTISSIDDLTKIKEFPVGKIEIIALYLELN